MEIGVVKKEIKDNDSVNETLRLLIKIAKPMFKNAVHALSSGDSPHSTALNGANS